MLAALVQEPPEYPPLGRLVDIGGYRLHIYCTGVRSSSKPTVILLHGLGDFSFDWALVQPEVARFTRVCCYDRAGRAWSEPGPPPRGPLKLAQELHALLQNAREAGPYVLVGHSWGGLLARVYAAQHRREVAGMVLVDSTHEDAYWEINDNIVVPRLLSDEQWGAIKPKGDQPSPARSPADVKLNPPFDRLPPEVQQLRRWARSLARPMNVISGGDVWDLRRDLIEVHSVTRDQRGEFKFRDTPLIVLSRAPREAGPIPPERLEYNRRLSLALAQASPKGKHVVSKTANHHIQLTEPELVVHAIREVVEASRTNLTAR